MGFFKSLLLLSFLSLPAFASPCGDSLSENGIPDPQKNLLSAGKERDYTAYSLEMDASLGEKLKVIAPWIPNRAKPFVVDVGMGTGALANALATILADATVMGIDLAPEMVSRANQSFQRSNLKFQLAAANEAFAEKADATVYCSVAHEIFSYGGFSTAPLEHAFKLAFKSLAPGGRIIIRDFVRPQNGAEKIQLVQEKSQIVLGQTFADFARDFSRPITLTSMHENAKSIVYETDYASAYEYMFRIGYPKNWKVELNEQFGFWTSTEAKTLLERVGFKVIHSKEMRNEWIEKNRLDGKVSLRDAKTSAEKPYPNYQILIVGEKP